MKNLISVMLIVLVVGVVGTGVAIGLHNRPITHDAVALQVSDLEGRIDRHDDLLDRLIDGPPYEQLQDATVRVDCSGGCGTGVLITRRVGLVKKTFVWTAGHVVQLLQQGDGTFRNAVIYQEEREGGEYAGGMQTEARVIAYSAPESGEDLALLEVLKDNLTDATTRFAETTVLPIGTELVHVGCTLGLYNSISRGIVSQTDRDILNTGHVFDQTTCMGYPGSSGGGVYLTDGRCVGLLVRGAGPGLNFIVPTRRMSSWAKKMKIEWAINPASPVHIHPSRDLKPVTDTPFVPCGALEQAIRRIIRGIIGHASTTYPLAA